MTNLRDSALTTITGANLASGDLFRVIDISDTTMASSGTSKKITKTELAAVMSDYLGVPVASTRLGFPGFKEAGQTNWYDDSWWANKLSAGYSGAWWGYKDEATSATNFSRLHITADDDPSAGIIANVASGADIAQAVISAAVETGNALAYVDLATANGHILTQVDDVAGPILKITAPASGISAIEFHDLDATLRHSISRSSNHFYDSSGALGQVAATRVATAGPTMTVNGVNHVFLEPETGYVVTQTQTSVIADASIQAMYNNQGDGGPLITASVDEAGNKLKFRVLYSNGTTLKSGEVALA